MVSQSGMQASSFSSSSPTPESIHPSIAIESTSTWSVTLTCPIEWILMDSGRKLVCAQSNIYKILHFFPEQKEEEEDEKVHKFFHEASFLANKFRYIFFVSFFCGRHFQDVPKVLFYAQSFS